MSIGQGSAKPDHLRVLDGNQRGPGVPLGVQGLGRAVRGRGPSFKRRERLDAGKIRFRPGSDGHQKTPGSLVVHGGDG